MAHTAPIILAFLLNCCEIFVFRSLLKVTLAPLSVPVARDIFAVGCYFLLLDLKLYPRRFKKAHWIARSFVEFILGIYILETFLCDFWYPLEQFSHLSLIKLIQLIKKKTPRGGPLCIALCNVVAILSNKNVPFALSIVLSTFITLIIIHGTRVVDINILRNCGLKDFVLHVKDKIIKGIKRFIRSLKGETSCRSSSTICSRPRLNSMSCSGSCNCK